MKTRYLLICSSLISIFLPLSSKDLPKGLGQGIVFASEIPNIKLIGTVTSNNEKFNLAIIENSKDRHQSVYHKGSQLPNGAKIKSIFPNHILVEKDGENRVLKITSGSGFNKKGLKSRGYQKISANKWIVNPNQLFKSARDIAKLCRELEIKKIEEGFLIEDIGDNDFLRELGLQEGDIIKKANGKGFDSLYAVLEYIWNLEDDSSLNIEIARNEDEYNLELYPIYDQLPSYVETGSITPHRINSMLKAKHRYIITNVIYK